MAKKEKFDFQKDILEKYKANANIQMTSTGSINLDILLGGGINKGSMYVFWGEQGCGKSTCASQIVRSFCREGKKVLFIDSEKALNGMQCDSFELTPFINDGRLSLLTIDNFIELSEIIKASNDASFDYDLVVIDSMTSINTFEDVENFDILDNKPAQHASQSQKVLNLMRTIFTRKGVSSIIICHARANISMVATPYSPTTKLAGGFALRHIPDVLVHVSSSTKLKRTDGSVYGQCVKVVAEKNKFAIPFNTREVKLVFGKGISRKEEVINFAIEFGLITTSGGGNYTLPDGTTVRGIDNIMSKVDETMLKALHDQVVEHLNAQKV